MATRTRSLSTRHTHQLFSAASDKTLSKQETTNRTSHGKPPSGRLNGRTITTTLHPITSNLPTSKPPLDAESVATLFRENTSSKDPKSTRRAALTRALKDTSYAPITKLGEGAYATVYKVKDAADRVFALKLFKPHCTFNSLHKEFIAITQLLAIDHNLHITPIRKTLNTVQSEIPTKPKSSRQQFGIFFDYYPATLDNLNRLAWKKQARIPIDQTIRILHDLLTTMVVIEKTHLHLDLKPPNILLDPGSHPTNGWDFITRIGDFGSTRIIDSTPPQTFYYETLTYRSPRILKAFNGCDIFSLGCILHELLLAETLFPTTPSGRHTEGFNRMQNLIPKIGYTAALFDKATIDHLDMIEYLHLVFRVTGHPSQSFIDSLNSDSYKEIFFPLDPTTQTRQFVKPFDYDPEFFEKKLRARTDLSEEQIKSFSDLLKKLVDFENPMTAGESLKHPVFADFTDSEEINVVD